MKKAFKEKATFLLQLYKFLWEQFQVLNCEILVGIKKENYVANERTSCVIYILEILGYNSSIFINLKINRLKIVSFNRRMRHYFEVNLKLLFLPT